MLFRRLCIHQYIVDIGDHEVIQIFKEYVVHERRERRRGVTQSERHHQKLEGPITGPTSHFLLIPLRNPYLVIS